MVLSQIKGHLYFCIMSNFFERYMQGFHQEVYNELLVLGAQAFDPPYSEDADLVMHEIMRRVRYNLEYVLIPRLHTVGYRFTDGMWENPDHLPSELRAALLRDYPPFLSPPWETPERLQALEQLVGWLPLSLKCWYEQIGAVNLIGAFPASLLKERDGKWEGYKEGYPLDPLYIERIEHVLDETRDVFDLNGPLAPYELDLCVDGDLKFGYSGAGGYGIEVPCQAIDGILLGERHGLTFVNYLRLCCLRAGFPGLGEGISLQDEVFAHLTEGLLPF
jgi:hypothetical protein